MTDDQQEHFEILMQSRGARQLGGNPFDFDWLPFITSRFGYRADPFTGQKVFHTGIDIAQPIGTPIRAGFDAIVITAGYNPGGYGNFIIIEDINGYGLRMLYAHCHELFVSTGQTVYRGDIIATVGNTGNSTGAHLHMEIFKDGQRLNPIFFVESF